MDFLNIADRALLLIPIGVIGLLRYSAWLIKILLSSFWRDVRADGPLTRKTIGVVVTVKGEPVETFHDVLLALMYEKIDQVNIVFDARETENMVMVGEFHSRYGHLLDINWKSTTERGKRAGLSQAIAMADAVDIIMCIDSDTILGEGVRKSVLETLNNSRRKIGGVTVQQRVRNPTKLPHFMFDIRLKLRYMQDLPGQALGGRVSCLSGRCSAYLAEPLQRVAPGLLTESWGGIEKTGGGDDKYLTTAIHDLGYNTVVITNASVYTRPEDNINVYLSQSLRWARNSWFSDLRALLSRLWMWKSPILLFYTLDRFMSTFTMIMAMWFMVALLLTHEWGAALILFFWWLASRAVKIWPYLWETKRFYLIVPYIFMTLIIAILKIHALVTLWETSWLTRGAKRGRQALKQIQEYGYRGVTSSVILAIGALVFFITGIWLADIPGLADLGNFYRPEDSGLFVEDDLIVNETDMIVLMPPNPSTELLTTVKDTALRLKEEFAEYQGDVQVKWYIDLQPQDFENANLILFGAPEGVAKGEQDVLATLRDLYQYPQRGERLADAEPFASNDDEPIRVVPSPWNEDNHILMVNIDDSMRYRFNGQTISDQSALTLISENMGEQYILNDTPYGRETDGASLLSGWDIRETVVQPVGPISRTYGLTIPVGVRFNDGLALEIDLDDLRSLSGMTVDIRFNGIHIGTVPIDGSSSGVLKFPIPASLINIYLKYISTDRLLTVTLEINRNDLVIDNLFDLWQRLDHAIGVILPVQPLIYDLASFPYPFTFNTDNKPTTIIMPDEIIPLDVSLMIQLVAQLGISAPDTPHLTVVRASQVTDEQLRTTNVIALGEERRQPYAQVIDDGVFQNFQFSFYQWMPNDDTGLIYILNSPWNQENAFLIVSSEDTEGYEYAVKALIQNRPLIDRNAYLVFVDSQLTARPLNWSGMDTLDLMNPFSVNEIELSSSLH